MAATNTTPQLVVTCDWARMGTDTLAGMSEVDRLQLPALLGQRIGGDRLLMLILAGSLSYTGVNRLLEARQGNGGWRGALLTNGDLVLDGIIDGRHAQPAKAAPDSQPQVDIGTILPVFNQPPTLVVVNNDPNRGLQQAGSISRLLGGRTGANVRSVIVQLHPYGTNLQALADGIVEAAQKVRFVI